MEMITITNVIMRTHFRLLKNEDVLSYPVAV
jgi:hypothetical protein